MQQTRRSAGNATISEVAQHWNVDRATATQILNTQKVPLIECEGPLRVSWPDVWSLEGCGFVALSCFKAYKEPMLRIERLGAAPANCRQADAYLWLVDLRPSALRARIARIRKPVIRLSARVQRVRPCDLDALLDQLPA